MDFLHGDADAQVFDRGDRQPARLPGHQDPGAATGGGGDRDAGDLVALALVAHGIGARGEAPAVAPGERIDDDAQGAHGEIPDGCVVAL
jgi:hypothetical protein